MIPKRPKHTFKGFTLVELLIAMVVTGIVLTAVATLAYALGTANDSSNDTAVKQAQVRYATLRISELIKYSKRVDSASEDVIVLWLDRDRNGELDIITELVAIRKVALGGGDIRLCEFNSDPEPVVLIAQCRNVEFMLDSAPPDTKFVGISFELEENDVWHKYQISATLRCKAG